jgi:hypothetical protein
MTCNSGFLTIIWYGNCIAWRDGNCIFHALFNRMGSLSALAMSLVIYYWLEPKSSDPNWNLACRPLLLQHVLLLVLLIWLEIVQLLLGIPERCVFPWRLSLPQYLAVRCRDSIPWLMNNTPSLSSFPSVFWEHVEFSLHVIRIWELMS